MTRIDLVHDEVARSLGRLESLFVDEVKLTFIARLPGNPEADIVITTDSLEELAKVVERRRNA